MLGSGFNLLICTSGQIKMSCGAYLFSGILPSTITFPCLYISQPPNFFVLCSWLTGPQGWTDSHSQCGYQDWLWYWGWQAGSDVQRVYSAKCKLSGTWWWCFYPAGCVWDPPFDQLLLVRPITEDGCALYTNKRIGRRIYHCLHQMKRASWYNMVENPNKSSREILLLNIFNLPPTS